VHDSSSTPTGTLLQRSRKLRPVTEVLCEHVFRPLARLVVLALLPLRVPPPAIVLASAATGIAGAVELARGQLVLAALLLQLKTVLDNADGQLARASGRVSVLGRYLDSEADLLVNAAVFAGLGYVTGQVALAVAAFLVLTLVLSVDFNLERLYRRERGEEREAMPAASGLAGALARVYGLVYAPQDRLVERFVESRLRGAAPELRLAYHDRATIALAANFGLSTQLAVLGACLVAGHPAAYLWLVVACGLALVPLELRRGLLARRARPLDAGEPVPRNTTAAADVVYAKPFEETRR
jgi:archaetidylinositol phosphate synthase